MTVPAAEVHPRMGLPAPSATVLPTLVVHTVGPVTAADRAYAEAAFEQALELAPVPVHFASVDLRIEPGWARPALVRVTAHYERHVAQAHADSYSIPEAVDMAGLRLRRRLDDLQAITAAA